ncbi:MAG: hypothetical protein ACREN7_03255 [Candidatus Dormibacteria bacterium]
MPELRVGEVTIRPSEDHRRRSARGAATGIGVVLLPIGLIVGGLTHVWGVLALCVLATLIAALLSYMGQGHNQLFIGPRGIRRIVRDSDLTATWASLRGVEVKIPGNRIVAFTISTSGLLVEPRRRRPSRATQALTRNRPEGFDLRLDRAAADDVVAAIAERRPDLAGLADWERQSHPGTGRGGTQPGGA